MRANVRAMLRLAALSLLALSGCANTPKEAPAPLKVEFPTTCERILKEVPLADAKPGDDADIAFMKADAATITANAHIAKGRNCIGDVRRRYQGGKP